MRYLDEFRDPRLAADRLSRIRRTAKRVWTLMEVCGGQTHSLVRHGIPEALAGCVELIHGPGCPVCVTSEALVDRAQALARQPETLLTTFGDMLRVPGTYGTLLDARRDGGNVQSVASPLDAVELAQRNPHFQVVFFAVGFETTVPASALAVLQASERRIENFSLLVAHVRVQPAMELLLQQADCRVQGLLAAGHVCTVVGYETYNSLVSAYGVPIVVTGFEPVDLLEGILACVVQLETHSARLENCYARTAKLQGNPVAQQLIASVFEPCDRAWRGLGTIPAGGWKLRAPWRSFDAERRFPQAPVGLPIVKALSHRCRASDVLVGRLAPRDCPEFGGSCRPDSPLGAPMVSSEGACAAYYHHAPSPPHRVPSQDES